MELDCPLVDNLEKCRGNGTQPICNYTQTCLLTMTRPGSHGSTPSSLIMLVGMLFRLSACRNTP